MCFSQLICDHSQAAAQNLTINACSDDAEWPDFIYFKRNSDSRKTREVTGHTVDLLEYISKKHKIGLKVRLLPWRRCLQQVQDGDVYNIATDAAFTKFRDEKYLLSEPYYEVSSELFYLKEHFPSGFPSFKTAKELFKIGSICGIAGYAYDGFLKDLDVKRLDMGSQDHDSVIVKLKRKRCVAFIARYEILKGFAAIGKDYGIGTKLGHIKVKGSRKDKFHFLISRKWSKAAEVKKLIDQEIKEFEKQSLSKAHVEK